jgi:hypothetical protein
VERPTLRKVLIALAKFGHDKFVQEVLKSPGTRTSTEGLPQIMNELMLVALVVVVVVAAHGKFHAALIAIISVVTESTGMLFQRRIEVAHDYLCNLWLRRPGN